MSVVPVLLRAALPSLPVVNRLPGVRKAPASTFTGLARTAPPVTIDRAHVERYARVCGFPTKDVVPLPYPHLLAFGMQMAMMSDRAFPSPVIGMVHVANTITQHRPVAVGESVTVTARVGVPVAHPRGTVHEFVTEVRAGDELVWEEVSAYLRRGRGDSAATYGTVLPPVGPGGIPWRLPADLGRRYAAVSGDRNPIHLYPLTARALGFPRQIAHGMWTLARSVAALENRLPDAVRVDVAFKRPVLLPGTVVLGTERLERTERTDGVDDDAGPGWAFSLTSPTGTTHLIGRTRPA
ncbi:MaoC/PaaZ C-terminal domain-containing protein [Nocardioides sp. 1609]|uniref:MaoC family dehydratase n=1 Tax=Nocardioides sp. 1609 TaxID=2508327 RepID=UPI00106F9DAE|nr:MaoC/PaaZ C-terminal domain-containing protein [Nocardioides sp. 1609]